MKEVWEPVLGYTPELLTLPRGWQGFIFKNPEETDCILNRFWGYSGCSLMLKRWRLGFNPDTKYFNFYHIWVLLLELPLQMWNQKALELIGNSIGHFLRVHEQALGVSDKRMAKVLVEVDVLAGLLESLDIEWRGILFGQRLDYLGISFRCLVCRRTRHLHRDR